MAYTGPHMPHDFQQIAYAAIETVFDTDAKPAAADALNAISCDFEMNQELIASEERTGNRMPPEHFPGMRSGKASLTFYPKPAAVGVEPDAGPIFEAALNTKTIVGGTSVTYAHADLATVKSLRLFRGAGNFMEAAYGGIVESLGIEMVAGQPTKCTVNIPFARGARAAAAVLTTGAAMGAGTCAVGAGKGKAFGKGSTVRFLKAGGGVEDNGGLGYLMTSDETDAQTFSPVAVSAIAIGDEIFGFCPVPTVAGVVCAAVNQDITIGGVTFNFLSAKLDYKTGFKHRVEGQSSYPSGVMSGDASISGEVQCYFRDDQHAEVSFLKWDKAYKAMTLRSGENTAAVRMKAVIANAVPRISSVKMPQDGSAGLFTVKFEAKTAFNVLFD